MLVTLDCATGDGLTSMTATTVSASTCREEIAPIIAPAATEICVNSPNQVKEENTCSRHNEAAVATLHKKLQLALKSCKSYVYLVDDPRVLQDCSSAVEKVTGTAKICMPAFRWFALKTKPGEACEDNICRQVSYSFPYETASAKTSQTKTDNKCTSRYQHIKRGHGRSDRGCS